MPVRNLISFSTPCAKRMRGIFHAAQSGSVRHAPQWKKCGKGQRPVLLCLCPLGFVVGIGRYARIPRRSLSQLCKIVVVLGPNFYKHTPSTVNISAFINNQVPFRIPLQLSIAEVRDVAGLRLAKSGLVTVLVNDPRS